MMAANKSLSKIRIGDLLSVDDEAIASLEINGMQLDSRLISAGELFVALKGYVSDGRQFLDDAVNNGAVAALVDADDNWQGESTYRGMPVVAVDRLAGCLSEIAAAYYQHPSENVISIGVTGTNGKTSCTQLYQQLINLLGETCGVIGTLGSGVDGQLNDTANTTPDAISIQNTLANWRDQKIKRAALEVSSHGLEQGRVASVKFEGGLFTNLSQDHLDYHGSMHAYGEAKAKMFKLAGMKFAVINIDDDFGSALVENLPAGMDVIKYSGVAGGKRRAAADVWVDDVVFERDGVRASVYSPWGDIQIHSHLLGAYNLSNLVAVIGCMGIQGFSIKDLASAIPNLVTVPGRMESVSSATDINVVVDYAHTPDALKSALQACRSHSKGNIWCVFGCGGDRDQGKRPLMGELAQRYADHVVITSDNPRSESAHNIINEILGGVDRPALVEEDRGLAIDFAISNANAGDCVLIAGKGHESYQQIGENKLPFSDSKQARLALSKRAGEGVSR